MPEDFFKHPSIDSYDLISAFLKMGLTWEELEKFGFYYQKKTAFTAQELKAWYEKQKAVKTML